MEACPYRDWLLEELPPALPLLSAEEREKFVSPPAFQPEGMHVLGGFLPCSLAMLMGFMTPLLAPEDRCEKGGGVEEEKVEVVVV